jgi:uncharacterized protein YegL
MPVGLPEFFDNPENRCPVVLLLDTSGSMAGEPIQELNRGVALLREEILRDATASLRVEVAIISFGPVQLVQDFTTIDMFNPPIFEAQDVTPMGQAIEFGLDLLEKRKATYRANGIQYYRPWMFLITDGAPTDSWQNAARLVRDAEAKKRISFFAVAVEGADTTILRQIAPPHRPPMKLKGLNFRELFLWLSHSLCSVSRGNINDPITLPSVGWGTIT